MIKQEKEDTEEYTGEGDYTLDLKTKQAYLTERGQEKVENWLIEQGLMPEGDSLLFTSAYCVVTPRYGGITCKHLI